ncbi:2,3-diaminopropionate biosynthesis protein SbnB [Actinomadura terrae]|uniref:2,3-diaminopropionate biosynthesis protein SbnB n=1 Tax=Actinomadura terrae TaxID=604353 RepID=UPI001FA777F6|nr:2,3-diaminopropionate biosynthesis protein SbnB [Actinomadura terrae]
MANEILADNRQEVQRLVTDTYLRHERGQTINPDSYFLRFPDKPDSRVIALPAFLAGEVDRIGIKWISSFPRNTTMNMPRASAVLLLNDYETGRPVGCLEAAGISAARTAASAAVAAARLVGPGVRSCAFVGGGVIARTILEHLPVAGVELSEVSCYDEDPASAEMLTSHAEARLGVSRKTLGTLGEALTRDLVVFATTAPQPYVPADVQLRPGQVLLNISLRDLPPEVLLRADNIVDDVEHCLKAQTSPHLAEQLTGSRDFITGTLGAVLQDRVTFTADRRPVIFSPFGLGVLDIAVGSFVLEEAQRRGAALVIPDFFGETRRW